MNNIHHVSNIYTKRAGERRGRRRTHHISWWVPIVQAQLCYRHNEIARYFRHLRSDQREAQPEPVRLGATPKLSLAHWQRSSLGNAMAARKHFERRRARSE